MKSHSPKAVFFSLASAMLLGCGTSATLQLDDGHMVKGRIVASTRDSVILKARGEKVAVPREEIVDIDHPGNGAAITGMVLAAFGALNIVLRYQDCGDRQSFVSCARVLTPAAVGLGLAGYGFTIWRTSRNALDRDSRGREISRTFFSPTFVQYGDSKGPGLQLVSVF